MGKVRQLAELMWSGEFKTHVMARGQRLVGGFLGLEELDDGVAFCVSFANVTVFKTDDGLVMVDTGSPLLAPKVREAVRAWTPDRLNTAVFTHGHLDHVFGVQAFEEESHSEGWTPPQVIAHEALPRRFDRYKRTAGYNAKINMRQFRLPAPIWPTLYRYPDRTYRERETVEVGGWKLELRHHLGETDDHTYVWVPSRKVLAAGDLFVWASPNCGNPQKVQRYPLEWAVALREMAALGAETLLPGHGPPVFGAQRIEQALSEAAELLETLHDQTVEMMNAGATLDDIVHGVQAPDRLLERPYLRAVYDEPEFVVRNIWRLYGGWYDGNPAHLKPAPQRKLAEEIAELVGGPNRLADRARALAEAGDFRLACHLMEFAYQAAPDDAGICSARADVYTQRASERASVMARGIFEDAVEESLARAAKLTGG